MKVGTLLLIFKDVFALLSEMNIIQANGDMRTPTADEDTLIAARVESILKSNGITVPDTVDKVLQILPIALSLAGVK